MVTMKLLNMEYLTQPNYWYQLILNMIRTGYSENIRQW